MSEKQDGNGSTKNKEEVEESDEISAAQSSTEESESQTENEIEEDISKDNSTTSSSSPTTKMLPEEEEKVNIEINRDDHTVQNNAHNQQITTTPDEIPSGGNFKETNSTSTGSSHGNSNELHNYNNGEFYDGVKTKPDPSNIQQNDKQPSTKPTEPLTSQNTNDANSMDNKISNNISKSIEQNVIFEPIQKYSKISINVNATPLQSSTTASPIKNHAKTNEKKDETNNDGTNNSQQRPVSGTKKRRDVVSPKELNKVSISLSDVSEKGAKVGGTHSSKIPTRLGVPLTGPPFESGVNTECIQLLRQLWNVHDEAVGFLKKIRSVLSYFRQELRNQENEFEISFKEKRLSTSISMSNMRQEAGKMKKYGDSSGTAGVSAGTSYGNGFPLELVDNFEKYKNEIWISIPRIIEGLKCISENFTDIEKQYFSISVFQNQCKLSLLAKVKNAKLQVTHDRLSIMHGVQHLITVTLNLISTSNFWSQSEEEKTCHLVQSVFQLTEVYNGCLESSSLPMEAAVLTSNAVGDVGTSASLICIPRSEHEEEGISNGKSEGTNIKDKVSSLSNRLRILVQINAANRNDTALLRLSLKPLSATRLLQIIARKRSTFAAHGFSRVSISNFYLQPGGVLSLDKFESCFIDEDSGLTPLGKGFSQCPSLLGRAAVKKTENGDQRLSRSARTKMYSYFHEVLWTLAGEHSEDLLLWGLHSNIIPLVLQPLDIFISLRNTLMLGQKFQESNLSPMLSAFDSVGGALHSFTLLANWDEKIREAFDETYKVKRPEQVALVSKPEPSQWATEIGSKFGQIVTTCISLIDGGDNGTKNVMKSMTMRLSNEEEHLGDEAQILFRLEATLIFFKAWVVKRSKVWLNGWAIPQFLAFSQRESALLVRLIKSREPILITRDFLLNNENVSIRLSAKHRQVCADDLRAALLQLQSMPEELLLSVGPVCNTLSLATLQSYMPSSNHWRGVGRVSSGLDPDKPSSYVKIFIDRIIEPVITASVELVPGPVQESMGKQTVHAACDAWLEYILQRKIKFSEWGAVQLLRDFTAFREWIRTETGLEKEARRAILQLEVLRRCEGVAYLLLRNPGDVLGVGKLSRKNRRIAPSSSAASVESSPSIADSTIDDDIPPEMYVPNQQMWLELRLRRSVFSSPCCL